MKPFLENKKNDNSKLKNIISTIYKKYNIININTYLDNYKFLYNNEIKPKLINLEKYNKEKKMTGFWLVLFLPQYLFILDDNFKPLVNDIINIKNIKQFMKNKFNIIMDNNKRNSHQNSNDNYLKYTNEQNRKDIKDIYKYDYKYLFN